MSEAEQDLENQSIAALFSGIVVDLQQLAEQQLQLAKSEVEDELHRRATSVKLILGLVAVLFLAAFNLCFAIVYLLHGVSSNSSNGSGGIPLWMCHLIVAMILAGIAGILAGLERASRLQPALPRDGSSLRKKDVA